MNTYADLKTTIADWLNREDLTTQIPSFVRLAESDIYRDLRCPDNEFLASYDNVNWSIDGQSPAAVSDGIAHNLPSNYASLRQIRWNGRPLESVSDLQLFARLYNSFDTEPTAFCVSGRALSFSSEIPTDPTEWADTDLLEISYYGVESLSSYPTWHVATNPVEDPVAEDTSPMGLTQTDLNTTRMLQRNPEIYLEGSLYYASLYLKDDNEAAKWSAVFKSHLAALKLEAKRNQYSGGTKSVASAY